jgi:hypothetical protein
MLTWKGTPEDEEPAPAPREPEIVPGGPGRGSGGSRPAGGIDWTRPQWCASLLRANRVGGSGSGGSRRERAACGGSVYTRAAVISTAAEGRRVPVHARERARPRGLRPALRPRAMHKAAPKALFKLGRQCAPATRRFPAHQGARFPQRALRPARRRTLRRAGPRRRRRSRPGPSGRARAGRPWPLSLSHELYEDEASRVSYSYIFRAQVAHGFSICPSRLSTDAR